MIGRDLQHDRKRQERALHPFPLREKHGKANPSNSGRRECAEGRFQGHEQGWKQDAAIGHQSFEHERGRRQDIGWHMAQPDIGFPRREHGHEDKDGWCVMRGPKRQAHNRAQRLHFGTSSIAPCKASEACAQKFA